MKFLIVTSLLLLSSCVSRKDVDAIIWLTNGLDRDMCGPSQKESSYPVLWDHGFYRKLNNGKIEFIPFCSPLALELVAAYKTDLNKVLYEAGLGQSIPKK